MIETKKAVAIEARLASLLEVEPEDVRDYFHGNIRAGGKRRTGYKFVRGTHGGSFVRDPDGTDILPAGYSISA